MKPTGFNIECTPRQREATDAAVTHKYTLFGGSRGPGKSWWLRHWLLMYCMAAAKTPGVGAVTVGLFCEDYPSLTDRQISKIEREWPRDLGQLKTSKAYGLAYHIKGGGIIALRNLDDPSKFQSAEFAAIGVDELARNPVDVFNLLRGSLRWPGLRDVRFVATANPGGIGHGWVRAYWIDRIYPPELEKVKDEFAFVRALPTDNPHLDPSYWEMLESLPPALARAWREGSWDAYTGQMFPISEHTHAVPPIPVPASAPVLCTFDWGYAAPFSVGWWWVDADRRLYRFAEWYGCKPGEHNVGLRLTDSEIAEGIQAREEVYGIQGRRITRLCDPTCFNRKPDAFGRGQGPSTAEVFAAHGLNFAPGDANRLQKIRQFHARVRCGTRPDGSRETPMLLVYNTCRDFLRTVPALPADPNNPEDVDTSAEDHCLSGDTWVPTLTGIHRLSWLAKNEPSGLITNGLGRLAEYRSARLVKKDAETVFVAAQHGDKGLLVRCTPDHQFLTADGRWVMAIDLLDETCQYINPWTRSSYLNAVSHGMERTGTSVDHTFSVKDDACIEKYGSPYMERFQLERPSIMLMATDPTTHSPIYASWMEGNTHRDTSSLETIANGSRPGLLERRCGMDHRKASNGIGSSTSVIAPPRLTSACRERARRVAMDLLEGHSRRSAQERAARKTGSSDIRIIGVHPAGNIDVYCLTVVDGSGSFVIDGGLVVSNCFDEAAHAVQHVPMLGGGYCASDDAPVARASFVNAGSVLDHVTVKG